MSRREEERTRTPLQIGGLVLGGRLDRYVLSLFLGSYAVALLIVVGLFLIMNLARNLDEFLQPDETGVVPAGTLVLEYYVYEMPFLYLQVAPLVTLLAGLFSLTKLLRHNEVVAVLGAGISSHRLLLPMFVCAGVLALSMLGTREWFNERIGDRRDRLEDRLTEHRSVPESENLWIKDADGHPVRLGRWVDGTPPTIEGVEAWRLTFAPEKRWLLTEAERAVWDPFAGQWDLSGGSRQDIDHLERHPEPVEVIPAEAFTPGDVRRAVKSRSRPLDLSFGEVRSLVGRDPDDIQLRTLLHHHLTFPLGHLVLPLVGLPLLLRRERARMEGLVGGFLFCVVYFGADFLCRSLGMRGVLTPLLAAWLPVLFFGSLGVVLFGSMRS